jgi:hypothetical protein
LNTCTLGITALASLIFIPAHLPSTGMPERFGLEVNVKKI